MEHDNHTFKRTYPLRKGEIDPTGIFYLGDGAWGVFADKPRNFWYLAKALQSNCYWLLTISADECLCRAYDNEGKLLDEVTVTSK